MDIDTAIIKTTFSEYNIRKMLESIVKIENIRDVYAKLKMVQKMSVR